MKIRHTAIKSFDSCTVSRAVVYYDVPILIQLRGDLSSSFSIAEEKLSNNGDKIKTPAQFIQVAKEMFSGINPNTGRPDVTGNEFYASDIPEGIFQGLVTPQHTDNGVPVFNGEGTFSIAELLTSIGVLVGNADSRDTLDKLSYASDYFNAGYNICCWGNSSPFFNLYERSELFNPCTRIELAYIIVMCARVLGSPFTGTTEVGVSFDWLRPKRAISGYTDWNKYNIGLVSKENTMIFDIHEYKGSRSMNSYIMDIKSGKSAIPLPMIMSLVELGVKGLFFFDDNLLSPVRQVSRGEVTYLFNRLKEGVK